MQKLITILFITISLQTTAQTTRPVATSAPVLVYPASGSTISAGQPAVFTWQAPVPLLNDQIIYKIKIVEIIGNQSPDEALRSNKPHFEKDSLKELSFQYPSSGPGLVAGKKYIWIVQSLNKERKGIGQNNGYSKVLSFSISPSAIDMRKR